MQSLRSLLHRVLLGKDARHEEEEQAIEKGGGGGAAFFGVYIHLNECIQTFKLVSMISSVDFLNISRVFFFEWNSLERVGRVKE